MQCNSWYKIWFNTFYQKLYSHRNSSEALKYVDYAIKSLKITENSKVLDLCCGSGRHIKIFSEQNINVFGLDLSPTLLDEARDLGIKKLVQGEMLYLPFKESSFDTVLNFFTSFGYYETDEKNRLVLSQIMKILKVGGKFMLDLPNPDCIIENLKSRDEKIVDNLKVTQIRHYNKKKKRIEKEIQIESKDGMKKYYESVRLYTSVEITAMIESLNMSVKSITDLENRKVLSNSERMIITGEKNK